MVKTAKDKQSVLPRVCDFDRDYVKDWERLSRSGRYDMKKLKEVMMQLIANEIPLGEEYRDHALSGDWDGFRECHIGGDFLLIYKLVGKEKAIIFTATGTHSELFG